MLVYARTSAGRVVHLVHASNTRLSTYALCGAQPRRGEWLTVYDVGRRSLCMACAIQQAQSPAMRATLEAIVISIDNFKLTRGRG